MAIIKCPECGKEISDKADRCISCGYPIQQFLAERDINSQKQDNIMSESFEDINGSSNGHVRHMAVRNRISYPVGDYLYHSNLRLWIRAGDRYRSIQNASCRFCTLYPACPFRLGSGMAGNNEDQIKRRLSTWK